MSSSPAAHTVPRRPGQISYRLPMIGAAVIALLSVIAFWPTLWKSDTGDGNQKAAAVSRPLPAPIYYRIMCHAKISDGGGWSNCQAVNNHGKGVQFMLDDGIQAGLRFCFNPDLELQSVRLKLFDDIETIDSRGGEHPYVWNATDVVGFVFVPKEPLNISGHLLRLKKNQPCPNPLANPDNESTPTPHTPPSEGGLQQL